MKKTAKIRLTRETLRALAGEDLDTVGGGTVVIAVSAGAATASIILKATQNACPGFTMLRCTQLHICQPGPSVP